MHLLTLSWLTNAIHIYQASITLLFYVFPVSWYWVCSSMQYDRYDLLHTRAKLIVYTVIIWYKLFVAHKNKCSVVSEVTDLRKYNYTDTYVLDTLANELFIFHQRNTSGLSKPGSLSWQLLTEVSQEWSGCHRKSRITIVL